MRYSSQTTAFSLLIICIAGSIALVSGAACPDGEVLINNVCTTNDITKPTSSTYAFSPKGLITFYVGQSTTDPDSLDFLITTPTSVNNFFVVFSDHYLNSDVVMFTVTNNGGDVTVTATDSYFTENYPNLPVSDTSLPGGVDDIVLLGYSATLGDTPSLTVKISRKYITNDKYDTQFSSTELFLQRVIYGVPQADNTAFADYYNGSTYFLLNTLTHPCGADTIFNGSACVANDLAELKYTYVAKQGANDFLTVNYEVTAHNQITFVLTAASTGYFGIGFGGNAMDKVDMLIFNRNADNTNSPVVIFDDSYASQKGTPLYDTVLGGTYDITVLGYSVSKTQIKVKFIRNMDTGDVFDFAFQANQDVPFSFAFSDSATIAYHNYSVGWGTLVLQAEDFVPCANGSVIINSVCAVNDLSTTGLTETAEFPTDTGAFFLKLQYGISGANKDELTMLFTIANIGWFGFGFAPNPPAGTQVTAPTQMTGADIFVFDTVTFPEGGQGIYAQDSYAYKNIVPNLDTSIGGTNDINLLGYSIDTTNKLTTVKISRKLDTGDVYDYKFVKGTIIGVLFAWQSSITTMQYHDHNTGTDLLNFYTSATDCKNGQILVDNVCVDNDLTALPSSASNQFLNLQFDLSTAGSVTFLLTVQNIGWFGLGFGSGMADADMVIITENEGIVSAIDYYSSARKSPQTDISLGGQNNIKVLGYEVTQTATTVKFSRLLDTGDQFDHVLTLNENLSIIYAWGSTPQLKFHQNNYAIGSFPLTQGYKGGFTKLCPAGQIPVNDVCQKNDIAGLPSQASNQFLNIQFDLSTVGSVTFLVTVQNIGWFGLGFGSSMLDSDMVIVTENEGVVSINDYYSSARQFPNTDVSLGGQDNLKLLGYQITDTATTVKFSRLLNTGDQYDHVLTINEDLNIIYAWGSTPQMSFHKSNYAYGIFPLQQGYQGGLSNECQSGQISVNNACQTNDLTSLPSSASDSFLNVQFDLSSTGSVTFLITVQNSGWFGLGFGSNMSDADMVIVQENSGAVTVGDYYSSARTYPSTDVQLGGVDNITLLGYQASATQTIVKFSRPLNTGDKFDHVLVENENLQIIYAWGQSSGMVFHEDNIAGGTFPLTQGYNGSLNGVAFATDPKKSLHFWANFFIWAFAIEFAILVVRFGKTLRFYREVHGILMSVIVGFSTYVELILVLDYDVLFAGGFSELKMNKLKAHALIGFIFLILIVLELIGGASLYFLVALKKQPIKIPSVCKIGHQALGYSLYVLGKTNVLIGASLTEDTGKSVATWVGTAFFLALRLLLEYLFLNKPNIFAQLIGLRGKQGEKEILNRSSTSLLDSKEEESDFVLALNSDITTSEIKRQFASKKYVLIGNSVFDISKLSHPGGNFIFEAVNGRDVGRFVNGSYGLESIGGKGYAHSKYAADMLKSKYIGEIEQSNIVNHHNGIRHLTAVRGKNLSSTTAVFLFSDPTKQLAVSNKIQGLSWLGRHFTVNYELQGETVSRRRIYTNCVSFIPENQESFTKMQENYSKVIGNKETSISSHASAAESKVLTLVVKRYESPTGFSQFIHDSLRSEGDTMTIKIDGPHGRGLELSRRSSGLHVIICGGTGVLPFFDLLVVFAKYVMFKALEKKHGVAFANQFDGGENQFANHINSGFKLKVIAAFNNASDDCTALRLLEFIRKVDVENSLNLFDAVVSVKGYSSNVIRVDQGHFNNQYIERHLGNLVISRAFVCGPPAINKQVPLALKAQGLTDDQIMIV